MLNAEIEQIDGSLQADKERNFRRKLRKEGFDTEVCDYPREETSVENSEKRALIRKSAIAQGEKLP